uniref:Uncharacterized protein n=1 Tax=Nelumbo nucifera TaxID=4432 RepID=A0A822XJU2_NELNU|nr:TPA_asm: hypothetical protein HUJ06_021436 [Nelumbo nucifera]
MTSYSTAGDEKLAVIHPTQHTQPSGRLKQPRIKTLLHSPPPWLMSSKFSAMDRKLGEPDKHLHHHTLFRLFLSDKVIFVLSSVAVVISTQLPSEYIDGNPVPRVLFTGRPFTFHAFLTSLTFALTGSLCAILLRQVYTKSARTFRCLSIVSVAAALAILAWLAFITTSGK